MRRTKIVCTIGPATQSPDMIEKLIQAGMNVARLNFSHGQHKEHGKVIAQIREIAQRLGRPVAILQDLSGPKVRTGNIAQGNVILECGQVFILTNRDVPGDNHEVSLTYKELPNDVRVDDTLLLSDGALEMVVEKTTKSDIKCRVMVGGQLSSHKGINLPTRSINARIPTEKDEYDLAYGLTQGVDYIALSFVRNAEEVKQVRNIIAKAGKTTPLIAKIEKHEALDHIEAILQEVDGIMIARGDLGVEIPIEQVPRVQKMLIDKANSAGKPVITATQMLKSMVDNPRPTRAEATDVANAVLDGSDAVMLSEETAIGKYPVETVQIMGKIIEETEAVFPYAAWEHKFKQSEKLSPEEAVALSACQMAEKIEASTIITYTQSGSTTKLVAKYRPLQPILALTPNKSTYQSLALVWGANPAMVESVDSEEAMEHNAVVKGLQAGYVQPDQHVVITAGSPFHVSGTTNLIKVIRAK